MRVLLPVLLALLHTLVLAQLRRRLWRSETGSIYRRLTLLAPVSVALSAALILATRLPLQEAGLRSLGDPASGWLVVGILGVPFALLTAGMVFLMPREHLQAMAAYADGNEPDRFRRLYVWVLVGPVEELLFRSFLQGSLSRALPGSLGPLEYATLVASGVFALIHLGNVFSGRESMRQFVLQLPGRFAAGLILGYSFQVGKSVLYPLLIHNVQDGLNLAVLSWRVKRVRQGSCSARHG
jgi:membrane protease YdiL (CAAX protease family)